MNHDEIYKLEVSMWEAAKARNSKAFLDVVSDDAVMVCGGYRCSGKEHSRNSKTVYQCVRQPH